MKVPTEDIFLFPTSQNYVTRHLTIKNEDFGNLSQGRNAFCVLIIFIVFCHSLKVNYEQNRKNRKNGLVGISEYFSFSSRIHSFLFYFFFIGNRIGSWRSDNLLRIMQILNIRNMKKKKKIMLPQKNVRVSFKLNSREPKTALRNMDERRFKNWKKQLHSLKWSMCCRIFKLHSRLYVLKLWVRFNILFKRMHERVNLLF